ncbi:glycosyltransferase domain-containing protein [Gordonia sputi]
MSRRHRLTNEEPTSAVYTAMIGRYERVRPREWDAGGVPHFFFTDDRDLKVDGWEMVRIKPQFGADPIRSARLLKIRGHEIVRSYERTLWIDNRVSLRKTPSYIFEKFLHGYEMAMPIHSFHTTVDAEFKTILRRKYDDPRRVREQYAHYLAHQPASVGAQPYWTAILARRRCNSVGFAEQIWGDHVLRYSRRDQLSLPYAVQLADVKVNAFQLDNFKSDLHFWHSEQQIGRDLNAGRWTSPSSYKYSVADTAMDLLYTTVNGMRNAAKQLREPIDSSISRAGRNTKVLSGSPPPGVSTRDTRGLDP